MVGAAVFIPQQYFCYFKILHDAVKATEVISNTATALHATGHFGI